MTTVEAATAVISESEHRKQLRRAVIAATVGTTIEWYDFFLYGVMAALVFPPLFFPNVDPFSGQILSFLTFTAGFVARPLGGVIFGHLGDRIGRKSTLVATLLLMGLSTVAIGLLPTHGTIGIAAPLLLTSLRCVQGVGVGGEWGGAVLLALEYGHRGKRGFYASWPQAGVPLGLLTSAGVVAVFESRLSPTDFLAWGWRVPFLLSALLVVVGLLIRVRILETPLFRQLQQTQQVAHAPVTETLRRHWREVLLAAGSRVSENSCFYLFSTYIIAYGKDVLRVEPGRIDDVLRRVRDEYEPLMQELDMALAHTWIAPAVEVVDRPTELLLLWALPDVAGFWRMRTAAAGDPRVRAFWHGIEPLVAGRERKLMCDPEDGTVLR